MHVEPKRPLILWSSKDTSGYPPETHNIFIAMQTYGLILADNGDARWSNDVLNRRSAACRLTISRSYGAAGTPGIPDVP